MESASSSSSQPPGGRRSCRVCSDEEDLFSQMRRTMYAEARRKDKKPHQPAAATEERKEAEPQPDTTTAPLALPQSQQPTAAASSPSFLAAGRALPCPPDATRLGRSTWTFLHSMAAYYPSTADSSQQQHASRLLHSLSSLYPCEHCASHLSSYYHSHPPEQHVAGRSQLSAYLCHVHNDVRARQGKRLFDCSRVLERWGGHDWDDKHDDGVCDAREYGDVEDEEKATR